MKTRFVIFLTGFFIWCLLNWIPDRQHLLVGAVVAALVAWIAGDFFSDQPYLILYPQRGMNFLFRYLPFFAWGCVCAVGDVVYRLAHPGLPVGSTIVKVTTSLKSDMGITFLSHVLTLRPGTMVVDVDRANNVLYIHCMNMKGQDVEARIAKILQRCETIVGSVFE
jgi:multicomponent Na+:H+ antiporter subunit E